MKISLSQRKLKDGRISLSIEFYRGSEITDDGKKALEILETKVAKDGNWRVQEMLAKAFDFHCQAIGYEKCLPTIEKWINNENPNIKRAVVEGLRIWTNRPYFKENPELAVRLIAQFRSDESEYLRKSIGNSLRDISKKHKVLVDNEVSNWNLADKKNYVYPEIDLQVMNSKKISSTN